MRVIACMVALVALISCSKEKQVEPLRTVRYITVETASEKGERIFSGYSKADIETRLSFRVPGRIDTIDVKVGSVVQKGDVIASLDPKDYVLELQQAEASVLEAESNLRKAEANYERIRNLYETESASRAELDAARTEYESGEANVTAALTKLNLARLKLSYTVLKAPLHGSIATKDVEINENVVSGQTVVRLNSDEQVKVSLAMPESLIDEVFLGQEVSVTFVARPGNVFRAKVSEIGVASTTSTTYPVTVQLSESSQGLRSGLSAEVIFDFYRGQEALVIPPYTVFDENGKQFVYTLKPLDEGVYQIEKKEILFDDLVNEGILVTQGLIPGDKVVSAGIQFIQEGQKVRLAK